MLKKAGYFMLWLCCICSHAYADSNQWEEVKTLSLQSDFSTTKDWHISAFQPKASNSNDYPAIGDVPAKICFWYDKNKRSDECTKIIYGDNDSNIPYPYQTISEPSVAHIKRLPPLLKLVTTYSGGGSGARMRVMFWHYDKDSDVFESSGEFVLSEQSEHKILDNGMLVTADYVWQKNETHFSSHHFYIEVYKFSDGYFSKVLGYLTPKKYPSLDDADTIDVIPHEISMIHKLLQASKNLQ